MRVHLTKVSGKRLAVRLPVQSGDQLGIFEAIAAAIWRIEALEGQIAASVTRRLAVAFDLASFAFVTNSASALLLGPQPQGGEKVVTMQARCIDSA